LRDELDQEEIVTSGVLAGKVDASGAARGREIEIVFGMPIRAGTKARAIADPSLCEERRY
jgi:hypothetical protein